MCAAIRFPWQRCRTVSIFKYQADLDYCLAQAAELLGGPAQPLWLEWELEKALLELATLEARRGLGRRPALFMLDRSRRGHDLAIGIERYRWQTDEGAVRVARVVLPCGSPVDDFWAVPRDEYRRFYRRLRRHVRAQQALPPVMHEAERKRLWDNTIGFLRCGQDVLRRYGVAPKRGLLLLGEPGNGKTMACRWLAGECRRRALEWKTVTVESYEEARASHELPALFRLDSAGILFFDDFDAPLRDRDQVHPSDQHSTFLGELDGMEPKSGVVFLFTSNAKLAELDPAMCRPGRLDVVIRFPKPDAPLRRRLIGTRWHADLLSGVDVETVVADTRGFSYAELEEAKKLLVMRYVETRRWDWPWVRRAMRDRHVEGQPKRPIGFRPSTNGQQPRAVGPAGVGL
jgi:hypothetical protein